MDPIESWLDAKEVRRLAESLMEPASEVDHSAHDAGYGEHFEGFVGATSEEELDPDTSSIDGLVTEIPVDQKADGPPKVMVAASNALADAKRLAEGSGMLTGAAIPEVDKSQGDDTGVADIEQTFCRLIKEENTDLEAIFLIDDNDQVVIDEVGNAKLMEAIQSLIKAAPLGEKGSSNFRFKIKAHTVLEIIPLPCNDGLFVFGAISSAPMNENAVNQVIDHFQSAVLG